VEQRIGISKQAKEMVVIVTDAKLEFASHNIKMNGYVEEEVRKAQNVSRSFF
jgi:hypothetical protein